MHVRAPRLSRILAATAFALVCAVASSSARAGCGCDHPPAAWAPIMPPFAWSDKRITINAVEGAEFVPGAAYEVTFENRKQVVLATSVTHLWVHVPFGLKPGPVAVEVKGPGYHYKYADSLFTALPNPFRVNPHNAAIFGKKSKVAISRDGTVLIPVDLSRVLDPMQFALEFADLPLAFDEDDVVLYNADGIDLTIFTLAVDDATERQWGSYYGWEVESDAGLQDLIYQHKVEKSKSTEQSDVFTYWRHEFYTYAKAHAPGGSHHVDEFGRHPDGTLHIDHEHLVIAISGLDFPLEERAKLVQAGSDLDDDLAKAKNAKERESAQKRYEDRTRDARKKAKRLAGGEKSVDLWLLTILAEHPIEPDAVVSEPLSVEDAEIDDDADLTSTPQ
jgi:hypothetical protein